MCMQISVLIILGCEIGFDFFQGLDTRAWCALERICPQIETTSRRSLLVTAGVRSTFHWAENTI